MAVNGQTSLQRRQATQCRSSTSAIIGSDKRCGLEKRSTTLAAAPEAWATVSGMSFGYWHAPARIDAGGEDLDRPELRVRLA